MISDVLFESAEEIRRYLPDFDDVYPKGSDVETDIQSLLERMDSIRVELDTPPKPERFGEPDTPTT